jgi:hypothetical protein
MNTKIYQIYHKPELLSFLDPAFIPFDHCEYTIENPEQSNIWREWPILRDIGFKKAQQDNADVWGFVSYKFNEKTNIKGQQFLNFIKDNPNNDVWFMEPQYVPKSPFMNCWHQGEIYHPGVSSVPNFMFKAAGNDIDVTTLNLRYCWYNFFVGNSKFWNIYFEAIDNILDTANKIPELHKFLFEESAGHGTDPRVPYWIFVVERMFPTLLALSDLRSAGLAYYHNDFVYR